MSCGPLKNEHMASQLARMVSDILTQNLSIIDKWSYSYAMFFTHKWIRIKLYSKKDKG